MLHTLILGLGRAGGEPHLPVLSRVRRAHPELFALGPVIAYDPFRPHPHAIDLVVLQNMADASA